MINYKNSADGIKVFLDGKLVGNIVFVLNGYVDDSGDRIQRKDGFRYEPVGNKKHAGLVYQTVKEVQNSLEAE